jgi:hypothetical protein
MEISNRDHEWQSFGPFLVPIRLAGGRSPVEFLREGVTILYRHIIGEEGSELFGCLWIGMLRQHTVLRWRNGRRFDGECAPRSANAEIRGLLAVSHVVTTLPKGGPKV